MGYKMIDYNKYNKAIQKKIDFYLNQNMSFLKNEMDSLIEDASKANVISLIAMNYVNVLLISSDEKINIKAKLYEN